MPEAHTRKHTFALIFIAIFVLIVGGGVLVATVLWSRIEEPYKGYNTAETFVEVPQGAGTAEIRRRLIEGGVVPDEYTFRAALWWSGEARNLQAGEYRFAEPMSPLAVIQKVGRGDIYTRRITFPEGLTIGEMAKLYESRGFGSAQSFIDAARDTSAITELDPEAKDLEGYLFPETYALPRGVPASRLVGQMVDRFLSTYTESMRQRAAAQALTTRQVVTLASLVEEETAQPQEHPLVAAVYRNRMRLDMPMQADPTVIYALQKSGRYNGNIRREDLQYDSPYNTYRHPGLPPGPIASPGKASLEAALAPADVPYLYFVSRNDGTHVFAQTLAQHNANVYEHQVLFFRKQRQEQRERQ
jgi:peptidoglycan lytic transglycosylase G